jgi:hypothetical protein
MRHAGSSALAAPKITASALASKKGQLQRDLVALLSQPGPVCAPDMVSVMDELQLQSFPVMIIRSHIHDHRKMAPGIAAVVFAALVGATSAVDNGIGERVHRCFH